MSTLRKTFLALMIAAAVGLATQPAVAAPMVPTDKPESTWQIWNPVLNWLRVYSTRFYQEDALYFEGRGENYDGTATDPAAPTSAYKQKQSDLREADRLENQGRTEEAEALRSIWE